MVFTIHFYSQSVFSEEGKLRVYIMGDGTK